MSLNSVCLATYYPADSKEIPYRQTFRCFVCRVLFCVCTGCAVRENSTPFLFRMVSLSVRASCCATNCHD
nr:MAG TPA: hypothetical protein [Caudoviricetes sp.]